MAAPPVTPGVHIQEKTQGLQLVAAQYGDELRPLVQSLWEFTLPTLATAFSDAGTDQLLWHECLQARSPPCGSRPGFNSGIRQVLWRSAASRNLIRQSVMSASQVFAT